MLGKADTHLTTLLEDTWQGTRSWENEGIVDLVILDELEGAVIHLTILRHLAQRSTGDRECLLLRVDLL